ncbi:substrate-binding domain-containing protein, partial [bacterium]|nr:substrate-binding domain-containing protein [bacterium]
MKKAFTIIVVLIFLSSCTGKDEKLSPDKISGDLIVFNAGSLIVPFKKIKNEFNKKYPDVNIMLEAAGSRTCARKITDMNRPCDIMASADYTVINKLLIPEYTDWNIKFAKNEMCIVYHKNSR